MPEFDKNAGYIWAIVLIGLAAPILMALGASLRLRFAKRRLERLNRDGPPE